MSSSSSPQSSRGGNNTDNITNKTSSTTTKITPRGNRPQSASSAISTTPSSSANRYSVYFSARRDKIQNGHPNSRWQNGLRSTPRPSSAAVFVPAGNPHNNMTNTRSSTPRGNNNNNNGSPSNNNNNTIDGTTPRQNLFGANSSYTMNNQRPNSAHPALSPTPNATNNNNNNANNKMMNRRPSSATKAALMKKLDLDSRLHQFVDEALQEAPADPESYIAMKLLEEHYDRVSVPSSSSREVSPQPKPTLQQSSSRGGSASKATNTFSHYTSGSKKPNNSSTTGDANKTRKNLSTEYYEMFIEDTSPSQSPEQQKSSKGRNSPSPTREFVPAPTKNAAVVTSAVYSSRPHKMNISSSKNPASPASSPPSSPKKSLSSGKNFNINNSNISSKNNNSSSTSSPASFSNATALENIPYPKTSFIIPNTNETGKTQVDTVTKLVISRSWDFLNKDKRADELVHIWERNANLMKEPRAAMLCSEMYNGFVSIFLDSFRSTAFVERSMSQCLIYYAQSKALRPEDFGRVMKSLSESFVRIVADHPCTGLDRDIAEWRVFLGSLNQTIITKSNEELKKRERDLQNVLEMEAEKNKEPHRKYDDNLQSESAEARKEENRPKKEDIRHLISPQRLHSHPNNSTPPNNKNPNNTQLKEEEQEKFKTVEEFLPFIEGVTSPPPPAMATRQRSNSRRNSLVTLVVEAPTTDPSLMNMSSTVNGMNDTTNSLPNRSTRTLPPPTPSPKNTSSNNDLNDDLEENNNNNDNDSSTNNIGNSISQQGSGAFSYGAIRENILASDEVQKDDDEPVMVESGAFVNKNDDNNLVSSASQQGSRQFVPADQIRDSDESSFDDNGEEIGAGPSLEVTNNNNNNNGDLAQNSSHASYTSTSQQHSPPLTSQQLQNRPSWMNEVHQDEDDDDDAPVVVGRLGDPTDRYTSNNNNNYANGGSTSASPESVPTIVVGSFAGNPYQQQASSSSNYMVGNENDSTDFVDLMTEEAAARSRIDQDETLAGKALVKQYSSGYRLVFFIEMEARKRRRIEDIEYQVFGQTVVDYMGETTDMYIDDVESVAMSCSTSYHESSARKTPLTSQNNNNNNLAASHSGGMFTATDDSSSIQQRNSPAPRERQHLRAQHNQFVSNQTEMLNQMSSQTSYGSYFVSQDNVFSIQQQTHQQKLTNQQQQISGSSSSSPAGSTSLHPFEIQTLSMRLVNDFLEEEPLFRRRVERAETLSRTQELHAYALKHQLVQTPPLSVSSGANSRNVSSPTSRRVSRQPNSSTHNDEEVAAAESSTTKNPSTTQMDSLFQTIPEPSPVSSLNAATAGSRTMLNSNNIQEDGDYTNSDYNKNNSMMMMSPHASAHRSIRPGSGGQHRPLGSSALSVSRHMHHQNINNNNNHQSSRLMPPLPSPPRRRPDGSSSRREWGFDVHDDHNSSDEDGEQRKNNKNDSSSSPHHSSVASKRSASSSMFQQDVDTLSATSTDVSVTPIDEALEITAHRQHLREIAQNCSLRASGVVDEEVLAVSTRGSGEAASRSLQFAGASSDQLEIHSPHPPSEQKKSQQQGGDAFPRQQRYSNSSTTNNQQQEKDSSSRLSPAAAVATKQSSSSRPRVSIDDGTTARPDSSYLSDSAISGSPMQTQHTLASTSSLFAPTATSAMTPADSTDMTTKIPKEMLREDTVSPSESSLGSPTRGGGGTAAEQEAQQQQQQHASSHSQIHNHSTTLLPQQLQPISSLSLTVDASAENKQHDESGVDHPHQNDDDDELLPDFRKGGKDGFTTSNENDEQKTEIQQHQEEKVVENESSASPVPVPGALKLAEQKQSQKEEQKPKIQVPTIPLFKLKQQVDLDDNHGNNVQQEVKREREHEQQQAAEAASPSSSSPPRDQRADQADEFFFKYRSNSYSAAAGSPNPNHGHQKHQRRPDDDSELLDQEQGGHGERPIFNNFVSLSPETQQEESTNNTQHQRRLYDDDDEDLQAEQQLNSKTPMNQLQQQQQQQQQQAKSNSPGSCASSNNNSPDVVIFVDDEEEEQEEKVQQQQQQTERSSTPPASSQQRRRDENSTRNLDFEALSPSAKASYTAKIEHLDALEDDGRDSILRQEYQERNTEYKKVSREMILIQVQEECDRQRVECLYDRGCKHLSEIKPDIIIPGNNGQGKIDEVKQSRQDEAMSSLIRDNSSSNSNSRPQSAAAGTTSSRKIPLVSPSFVSSPENNNNNNENNIHQHQVKEEQTRSVQQDDNHINEESSNDIKKLKAINKAKEAVFGIESDEACDRVSVMEEETLGRANVQASAFIQKANKQPSPSPARQAPQEVVQKSESRGFLMFTPPSSSSQVGRHHQPHEEEQQIAKNPLVSPSSYAQAAQQGDNDHQRPVNPTPSKQEQEQQQQQPQTVQAENQQLSSDDNDQDQQQQQQSPLPQLANASPSPPPPNPAVGTLLFADQLHPISPEKIIPDDKQNTSSESNTNNDNNNNNDTGENTEAVAKASSSSLHQMLRYSPSSSSKKKMTYAEYVENKQHQEDETVDYNDYSSNNTNNNNSSSTPATASKPRNAGNFLVFTPSAPAHQKQSNDDDENDADDNDNDGDDQHMKGNANHVVKIRSPEEHKQIERNRSQAARSMVSYDEDDFSEGGVVMTPRAAADEYEENNIDAEKEGQVSSAKNNSPPQQQQQHKTDNDNFNEEKPVDDAPPPVIKSEKKEVKKQKEKSFFATIFSCFSTPSSEDDKEDENNKKKKDQQSNSNDSNPIVSDKNQLHQNPLAGRPHQEQHNNEENVVVVENTDEAPHNKSRSKSQSPEDNNNNNNNEKLYIQNPAWALEEQNDQRQESITYALKKIWRQFVAQNAQQGDELTIEEIEEDEQRFNAIAPALVKKIDDHLLFTTANILDHRRKYARSNNGSNAASYNNSMNLANDNYFINNGNNDNDDDDQQQRQQQQQRQIIAGGDEEKLNEAHVQWRKTIPKVIRVKLREFFSYAWDYYDPDREVSEEETVFFIQVVTSMCRSSGSSSASTK